MQHLTPTEAAARAAEATIYRAAAAARETQLAAAVAALRAEHPELEAARRPWTEAFGDAKYVTLSRNISPELEALAKAAFGEIEGVWPSDQPWRRAVCENSIKRLK